MLAVRVRGWLTPADRSTTIVRTPFTQCCCVVLSPRADRRLAPHSQSYGGQGQGRSCSHHQPAGFQWRGVRHVLGCRCERVAAGVCLLAHSHRAAPGVLLAHSAPAWLSVQCWFEDCLTAEEAKWSYNLRASLDAVAIHRVMDRLCTLCGVVVDLARATAGGLSPVRAIAVVCVPTAPQVS